jgi:hypothetical protein
LLFVVLAMLAALGIGLEIVVLEASRRAEIEQLANEAVGAKVQAARAHLDAKRWDAAAVLLEEALATPDATELAQAEEMLAEARAARATALLTAAIEAVEQQDAARARALLQAYLDQPHAPQKAKARRWLSDLEVATSLTRADAVLRQQAEQALTAFARGEDLPVLERLPAGGLRRLYAATLRTQLTHLRQEQAQQLARIQATPAHKELIAFAETLRGQRASGSADPQLFGYLFRELDVTDPAEQKKVIAELTNVGADVAPLLKRIASERFALKERFRGYQEFDAADRARFEQLVDETLDKLTRELRD